MSAPTTELLQGRMARCPSCNALRPSADHERLAFFEYRGPGSRLAVERCKRCGYSECAHRAEHMEGLVHGPDGKRRPTVVEDGRCAGFEADPDGMEYDSYYCGCRGWD